jgi:hypothetical protein
MDTRDLDNRFAFHPASTQNRQDDHSAIRVECRGLADFLNDRLPEGREKSLAITHLEEVMMWSNAAIARQK